MVSIALVQEGHQRTRVNQNPPHRFARLLANIARRSSSLLAARLPLPRFTIPMTSAIVSWKVGPAGAPAVSSLKRKMASRMIADLLRPDDLASRVSERSVSGSRRTLVVIRALAWLRICHTVV